MLGARLFLGCRPEPRNYGTQRLAPQTQIKVQLLSVFNSLRIQVSKYKVSNYQKPGLQFLTQKPRYPMIGYCETLIGTPEVLNKRTLQRLPGSGGKVLVAARALSWAGGSQSWSRKKANHPGMTSSNFHKEKKAKQENPEPRFPTNLVREIEVPGPQSTCNSGLLDSF